MNVTSNASSVRVEVIRERVTIFEIFERMGIDVPNETHQMRCPFHNDHSPSARVYAEQNKIYCFTCQKSWDVIDAVVDHFKLSFADALTWLEQEFGIGGILPTLQGSVRTALAKKHAPNVVAVAETVEQILKDRRDQLGFDRYTRCLLALDLTVYESQQRMVKADVLQQRMEKILKVATVPHV